MNVTLDPDLESRIAAAARTAGISPDDFIRSAITESLTQAEAYADFHAEADARWAEIEAGAETLSQEELEAWLKTRIEEEFVVPEAQKLKV